MGFKPSTEAIKSPFENLSEVLETPDIEAFRAYRPGTQLLEPAVQAQYASAERDLADQYANYSGIPSQVARNRLMGLGREDLMASKALALAQGNTEAQRLRMAQLQSLADLTAKRKQSGYNTQIQQKPGWGGSLISAATSVGIAA